MKVLKNYKKSFLIKSMQKVHVKTLSFLYHAKEDRMILLINKDDVSRMTYWITRRFYFSMLFELDTYLDKLGIENKTPVSQISIKKNKVSTSQNNDTKSTISNNSNDIVSSFDEPHCLLENVNLSSTLDKERFSLIFKAEDSLSESMMTQNDFINFYDLMKKSIPKNEWGIV